MTKTIKQKAYLMPFFNVIYIGERYEKETARVYKGRTLCLLNNVIKN